MRKVILILIMVLFSFQGKADEYYQYTKITCIPEFNYFAADGVNIRVGSDEEDKAISNMSDETLKKYGFISENNTKDQKCRLANGTELKLNVNYKILEYYKVIENYPNYDKPRPQKAALKLWENGKLIVDLDSFNSLKDRDNRYVRVTYKAADKSKEFEAYMKKKYPNHTSPGFENYPQDYSYAQVLVDDFEEGLYISSGRPNGGTITNEYLDKMMDLKKNKLMEHKND